MTQKILQPGYCTNKELRIHSIKSTTIRKLPLDSSNYAHPWHTKIHILPRGNQHNALAYASTWTPDRSCHPARRRPTEPQGSRRRPRHERPNPGPQRTLPRSNVHGLSISALNCVTGNMTNVSQDERTKEKGIAVPKQGTVPWFSSSFRQDIPTTKTYRETDSFLKISVQFRIIVGFGILHHVGNSRW